jgi:hypothetical protein
VDATLGLPNPLAGRRMKEKTEPRSDGRSHSAMPLILLSLVAGVLMVRWLGQRTRELAGTEWSEATELHGVALGELPLADGTALAIRNDSTPHVVYLFQYDCAACDAQRAHVAELLETMPVGEVISATAQPGSLSPGYWGDIGSSLAAPVGADSAWLASKHIDRLPLMLFVDKSGTVKKAIRGSVLGWSELAIKQALAAVGPT